MAETTYSNALKKAVCSITTVLCDELLEICEEESMKRKRKVWVRNWMDKKKCGASETIIREFRDNDPLEFKSGSIFPGPTYLTKNIKKRKPPTERQNVKYNKKSGKLVMYLKWILKVNRALEPVWYIMSVDMLPEKY